MMKIEVNERGELVLSEVFNGIGIQTDCGLYGIAQRDGGIEVMLNGKLILSDSEATAERLHVQLAGCSVAALGESEEPVKPGDYGWSAAYQDVRNLRLKHERLCKAVNAAMNELGVPQPGYPAPVANAVELLKAAIPDR